MSTIDERITAAGRAQRIAYADVGTTDAGVIEAGIIETVGEVATAEGVTGHWNQETDTWTSDAKSHFVEAVGGHAKAVEYEQFALAVGRDFLPPFARTVLDGGKSCAEYWEWLTESVEIAEREAAAAAIEREDAQ